MKYFFDTEFIEGFKKPIKWLPTIGSFNKPYHSIQLISIGIVCEDGREYYAISNEFNPDDANEWVLKNVLAKLPEQFEVIGICSDESLIYHDTWKSNKQIANEAQNFVCHTIGYSELDSLKKEFDFYAYYADYDWVVFCSLFGTMMDLPKGFPMYCRDLKQMLDERADSLSSFELSKLCHTEAVTHNVFSTYDTGVLKCTKTDLLKRAINYPKQDNEHNALDDAKWNFELYKFLKQL